MSMWHVYVWNISSSVSGCTAKAVVSFLMLHRFKSSWRSEEFMSQGENIVLTSWKVEKAGKRSLNNNSCFWNRGWLNIFTWLNASLWFSHHFSYIQTLLMTEILSGHYCAKWNSPNTLSIWCGEQKKHRIYISLFDKWSHKSVFDAHVIVQDWEYCSQFMRHCFCGMPQFTSPGHQSRMVVWYSSFSLM